MAEFFQIPAYPGRMSTCLDNNRRVGHTSELLSEASFCRAHGSLGDNVALSIENAPMTLLVSEINTHRLPKRFSRLCLLRRVFRQARRLDILFHGRSPFCT